jgi:hypothetical protein
MDDANVTQAARYGPLNVGNPRQRVPVLSHVLYRLRE